MSDTDFFIEDQLIYRRKVEIQVAMHCNLSCKGCVHASPYNAPQFVSVAQFERDLAALAKVMRIRMLAVLGGEPLLHPELVELLKVARRSELCQAVSVWTNGVGLEKMPDEFFANLDVLQVSRYPQVHYRFTDEEMQAKAKAFGFTYGANYYATFQHANLNTRNTDAAQVNEIYRRCKSKSAWSCHTLADGSYYKCSRAPLLADRLAHCGHLVDNRAADGIALHDNPALFEQMVAYLRSEQALQACDWCLGTDGASYPHQLQNKIALRQLATEAHPDPAKLFSAEATPVYAALKGN